MTVSHFSEEGGIHLQELFAEEFGLVLEGVVGHQNGELYACLALAQAGHAEIAGDDLVAGLRY